MPQTTKNCPTNYDNEFIKIWQTGTNFQQMVNGFYILQGGRQILELRGPILEDRKIRN
jgi:hypothetical protein